MGAWRARKRWLRHSAAAAQLDSRSTTLTACHLLEGFLIEKAYAGRLSDDIHATPDCD
jgi:hypothetical protein